MALLSLEDYTIFINEPWADLKAFVEARQYSSTIVLADSNTSEFCLPILKDKWADLDFTLIEIPAGEQHKTLDSVQFIWKKMFAARADRKSLMINLGGGMIGDIGGFAASTYMRGIDFLQIPTTLLSQQDSSIGSKLGFDFDGIKNGIGLFKNPIAVWMDDVFFHTLSEREMRGGLAEMIKHALIANKDLWHALQGLETPLKEANIYPLLRPSLLVKKDIVERDKYEQNIRKALNFGHTIGHALESISLETSEPLIHGEAIGYGMISEAHIAYQKGILSEDNLAEISSFLRKWYPNKPAIPAINDIMSLVQNDKKNRNQRILCTLISDIGTFEIDQEIDKSLILSSLDYLKGQY